MLDYYATKTFFDLFTVCMEIMLAIIALIYIKNRKLKFSFAVMALFLAFWHLSFSRNPFSFLTMSWHFQWLEILRYMGWLLLLLYMIADARRTHPAKSWLFILYASITICLTILLFDLNNELSRFPYPTLWLYSKIILTLVAIVMAEQLIRNRDASRITKFAALIVITQAGYDALVYCNLLFQISSNENLWFARVFISSATSLLLALCIIIYPFEEHQENKFKLSNPVILFNTSFILIGSFFVFISLLSFIVNFFNIQWSEIFSILFYVMAILTIATLSSMEKFRRKINVWTSKHFFSQKYDYHKQWLKLDLLLSKKSQGYNSYETALLAMSSLFEANAGGLWIKGPQFFSLVAKQKLDFKSDRPIEANSSDFIRLMQEKEWIYQSPQQEQTTNAQYNLRLPKWFLNNKNSWVIIPLHNRGDLFGFIFLCKTSQQEPLTWEDLDILKLTGSQIASYIKQRQNAEKLAQNKKFDLFNKLTAFAIHDIKNLLAQQSLMVKNADKFKNNPEFINDMIFTLSNSVKKMEQLLIKLQGNPLGKIERIDFKQLLQTALQMNSNSSQEIKFSSNGDSAFVQADHDKLLMVINHLIKNALDASENNGSIYIELSTKIDELWLEIKDSGCGMEQSFIDELLFKPFSSTKKNQGMGLGAYQIKELIHSLQGELFVESIKGKGSTFTIYLPLSADK